MDERLRKQIQALRRKAELQSHFEGNLPYTDEEQKLADSFKGPTAASMAKQAIALRRKSVARNSLNNPDPMTDEERNLTAKFGGPSPEIYARAALRAFRQGKILKYLSGDENSRIEIKNDKSGSDDIAN